MILGIFKLVNVYVKFFSKHYFYYLLVVNLYFFSCLYLLSYNNAFFYSFIIIILDILLFLHINYSIMSIFNDYLYDVYMERFISNLLCLVIMKIILFYFI